MDNLNLVSQKFFGTKLDETFKQVLITNIEPIFLGIKKEVVVLENNEGFYQSSYIRVDRELFRLIKITPGNVILDTLKVVNPQAEKIFFIGIVGSLNDQKMLGEIVVPSGAVSLNNLAEPILFLNQNHLSSGKICQVDGLVQERKVYQYLLRQKIDFVDMESYDFAVFGKKNHKKNRLIGIISDKPVTKPFYKVNKPIKIDYQILISQILND